MGQRENGVSGDEPAPVAIEREIGELREDLDQLVDELDRRRHDALDWRLQLRKHARPIAVGACVVLGGAVLIAARRRRRQHPPSWSDRLGVALHGPPVQPAPSLVAQLSRAVVLALVSAATRHVAERAIGGERDSSSSPSASV